MNSYRFIDKVIFRPHAHAETTKRNPCSTTQLVLTAIQSLWIYDYLLTLGDEVPCVSLAIETPNFDRLTDTLRLVREEVMG
jgi:hypothetical protein